MKIDIQLNEVLTLLHEALSNKEVLREGEDTGINSKHFHGKLELIFKQGNLATVRIVYETVKFNKEDG